MATELCIKRRGSIIAPASALDLETLERIPNGVDLACKIWSPRSLQHQRFYRGLLSLVAQATDRFPSAEALHLWLKIKYGLVEAIDTANGVPLFVVRSTAFDHLDEAEFKKFSEFAIHTILTEILPGVPRRQFVAQIEEMCGVAPGLMAA